MLRTQSPPKKSNIHNSLIKSNIFDVESKRNVRSPIRHVRTSPSLKRRKTQPSGGNLHENALLRKKSLEKFVSNQSNSNSDPDSTQITTQDNSQTHHQVRSRPIAQSQSEVEAEVQAQTQTQVEAQVQNKNGRNLAKRPLPSYGVVYSPISIVNPLIRPDGLGVRFPNFHSLAGTYDIVFYFAQWNGDYIHHRTTKGTLILSVSNEESVYCKERRRFIRRKIPRGGETLKGFVQMDDVVKTGDQISMGWYNFSFLQNNLRFRVVIDPAFQSVLTEEQIRKANAEIDIHVNGCYSNEMHGKSDTNTSAGKSLNKATYLLSHPEQNNDNKDILMHRGRIKLVTQLGPLCIRKNQSKECLSNNSSRYENTSFRSVKEAQIKLKDYMNVETSWMSNHLNLPKDVLSVIRQFICPPPVFFFEKGDLWIEVDWIFKKGDLNSIFVARKRS